MHGATIRIKRYRFQFGYDIITILANSIKMFVHALNVGYGQTDTDKKKSWDFIKLLFFFAEGSKLKCTLK